MSARPACAPRASVPLCALAIAALSAVATTPGCDAGWIPHGGGTDPVVDAGGGGGGDSGGSPTDASSGFTTQDQMIRAYGDCMRYDDWLTAQLTDLPAVPTDNATRDTCQSCHGSGDGTGGAYLNADDPTLTYSRHRAPPGIYKIATVTLAGDGSPLDVVENHRYVTKGQENTSHPPYTLPGYLVNGLDQFYQRTHQRFVDDGGQCQADNP